jgi:uncharacterized repeat protein (TIGR01451 family)
MKKLFIATIMCLSVLQSFSQLAERSYLTKKAYENSTGVFYADFDNNGIVDYFLDVPKVVEMNAGSPYGFQIPLTTSYSYLSSRCVVDMNNDGFLDIVANVTNGLIIFFNQNGESFEPFNVSLGNGAYNIGFDYDDDGDMDISYNAVAYMNDGSGQNYLSSGMNVGGFQDFYFDWNNDGIKDLIYYNIDDMMIEYGEGGLNFGSATLLISTFNTISPLSSTFQDFDADGDLDFVLVGNTVKAYVSNGTGGFSSSNTTIVQNANETYLTAGDYDGNGEWDVVGLNTVTNFVFIRFNYGTPQFNTPKNLGNPKYYLDSESGSSAPTASRITDANQDGKDELIFNMTVFGVKYWFVYDTAITAPSNQPVDVVYSTTLSAPTIVDFNGDGNKDIICMDDQKAQVLYQASDSPSIKGREYFFIYPGSLDPYYDYKYDDFNEDGWQDLVMFDNVLGVKLCLSNQGAIDTTNALVVSTDGTTATKVFDLNEDGHLDILHHTAMTLYLGDGMGGFTNLGDPETYNWGTGYLDPFFDNCFHDFDNNGRPDVLVSDCRIAYQMSTNVFSLDQNVDFFANSYADVGHFDNNGFIDIIYQNSSYAFYILLNNGFNNFVEGPALTALLGANVDRPRFIDYDGDGDQDIIGHIYSGGNGPYTYNVYVNNGNGTWTSVPLGQHKTRSFEVVDYDGDGDEDVLFFYDSTVNAVSDVEKGVYWLENLSTTQYVVSGVIYYDENQNGIRDQEETTTFGFNQISSSSGDMAYSQNNGNYTLYHDQPGTYTITTLAPDGFIFTTPNEYSVELNAVTPNVSNIDFGVYPAGLFTAGEADIVAFKPICDSQGAVYLQVTNTGTQNVPVEITFELPDYTALYQSTVDTTSATDSTLIWSYDEIGIGSSINIPFYLTYPSVDYIDSTFTYVYHVQIGDVYLTDTLEMGMLCAYDPNIKVEQTGWGEQGYFLDGQTLEYIVYFQNTGNYFATNVRLEDQLSDQLISSSLEVVSSSHTMETTLDPNGLLTFYFPNIMLPDSTSDPLGSIGFVKFRIDHAPTLEPGDVIENYVDIYFDFNPEITTNTEINTMYDCELEGDNIPDASIDVVSNVITANEGFDYEWFVNDAIEAGFNENEYSATESGVYQVRVIDPNGCSEISEQVIINSVNEIAASTWSIFPNPTNDRFIISGIEQGNTPLIIYDMMGKNVMSINVSNGQEINVNSLSAGIYVLMINGEQKRLVVER